MLIRLNKSNPKLAHYDPPFPIKQTFGPVDRKAPVDQQIEAMLWIPAVLVCQFLHQFPFLEPEADELFSIGVEVVVDKANNSKASASVIGSHVFEKARVKIEEYANSLNSIAGPSTRTMYKNLETGKHTPHHVRLTSDTETSDSEAELLVRDAAEYLGIDLETATLAQRRTIADTLGLKWRKE